MKKFMLWVSTLCVGMVMGSILAVIAGHSGFNHPFLVMAASFVAAYFALRSVIFGSRDRDLKSTRPTYHTPSGPNVVNGPPRPTSTRHSTLTPGQIEYNKPGEMLGDSGGFSDSNVAAGRVGEEKTAEAMRKYLANNYPGAIMIHTLQWPGAAKGADIDHVILIKTARGRNVLFCIDSKRWKNGDYVFYGDRAVVNNGMKTYDVHFDNAVTAMRKIYGGQCDVVGVIAVHGAQKVDKRTSVSTDMIPGYELGRYIKSHCDNSPSNEQADLVIGQSLFDRRK